MVKTGTKKIPAKYLFLLLFFLPLLFSCSGKGVKGKEEYDPEKFLSRADKFIDDKEYAEARNVLLEVKNRDTSKKYAPLAQLKTADSYIKEQEPEIGIEEYRRFLEFYPDNKYASYAQYQIAMAYYSQIESPDRGSGAAQKALNEFMRLKELYPRNPYREVIALRIEKCRNVLADSDFLIGEFYYKKESYSAAAGRFEEVLKRFPEYKKADETLYLLGKSYKALGKAGLAKEAFDKLTDKHPSSKFASKAQKESGTEKR